MRTIVRAMLPPAPGVDRTLQSCFAPRHTFTFNSGRAALYASLVALKSLRPGRSTVAIPAYDCFSVPAAIIRAGLKVLPVDIDLCTLDYDFSQLQRVPAEDLLAVVSSNLFGLVNDLPRIIHIARSKGAYMIDDAAQALGAIRNGILAGSSGDVGVYSFGRGKCLPTLGGGVAITNREDVAEVLATQARSLPAAHGAHTFVFRAIAYSVLLRPSLYWLPNGLPPLKLGTTEFDPQFAVTAISSPAESLIAQSFSELGALNHARRNIAGEFQNIVASRRAFQAVAPAEDCSPTWIRFPVLARDCQTRDLAVATLLQHGIGASAMYPAAICEIPGISAHLACRGPCVQAKEVAARLLTLPTHAGVMPKDLCIVERALAYCEEAVATPYIGGAARGR